MECGNSLWVWLDSGRLRWLKHCFWPVFEGAARGGWPVSQRTERGKSVLSLGRSHRVNRENKGMEERWILCLLELECLLLFTDNGNLGSGVFVFQDLPWGILDSQPTGFTELYHWLLFKLNWALPTTSLVLPLHILGYFMISQAP